MSAALLLRHVPIPDWCSAYTQTPLMLELGVHPSVSFLYGSPTCVSVEAWFHLSPACMQHVVAAVHALLHHSLRQFCRTFHEYRRLNML